MNPGVLSVQYNRIVFVAMALLLVGGAIAYSNLGRLEDPEFTIKQALIVTPYPGASAAEVAQEVTNPIERACQSLGQLDRVESESTRGRSVAVMQSNNSFTVGGSLSVNCHGWQYGRAPIASTVESFRLMKADGSIVRCSREENAELFSLVLGGYGLFGIILNAELRVVYERVREKRGTMPVIGSSKPARAVRRSTMSRARYCASASMSGAV